MPRKKTAPRAKTHFETAEGRVTSLELFFDLVFVFTLTQLTALLSRSFSWERLLQAFLTFIILFWMYGGYVWLTNSVPPTTSSRQLLLIAGMAAFLICALAIPQAFGDSGLAFAIGYLIVMIVHGLMYARAVGLKAARFVPMNFLAAGAILAAAFFDGMPRYFLWLLAIGLHVFTSLLGTEVTFEIRVGHFVERHGSLLLVALGESIVAIGAGALELTPRFFTAAVLGLILCAALWWVYFARDEERGRENMLARPAAERPRQALGSYFYAFIPMLFGIILLATGIKSSIEHLTSRLDTAHAFAFGGGVGLYLLGTTIFRRFADLPSGSLRYGVAVLAVLTGFLGAYLYAALQFLCLILILAGLVVLEANVRQARPS